MARRMRYLGVSSGSATYAGWASNGASSLLLLMGKTDGDGSAWLELAKYSLDEDLLEDEVCVFPTQGVPQAVAVHPGGHGALCSFPTSCRLVQVGESSLGWSDKEVQGCHGAGKICFSVDGSRVAFGEKDGRLRVFEWSTLTTLIDEPKAHKSIKDLDFSLDGALLASTSDDGSCRIWDLSKAMPLVPLHRDKAEKFGLCRFSRSGTHPFLYVTMCRDGKGSVAVWEIGNWNRLGSKKFMDCEITSLATSCDGKRLAVGGEDGAVAIILVKNMEKEQHVQNAHASAVTLLEMSSNSRTLVSLSGDGHVRVTATNVSAAWKDWQVYFLLAGLIAVSAALFYMFFEFSDSFWEFPLGRNQPARPSVGAVYGKLDPSIADS